MEKVKITIGMGMHTENYTIEVDDNLSGLDVNTVVDEFSRKKILELARVTWEYE